MGRLGNQVDHLLGSMTFAKQINRTLVVPPFRTYKNVPYSDWFKLDKMNEFHRSISAEDFMLYLAPTVWPREKRHGFCWLPPSSQSSNQDCQMKYGNPSENFWSELGVDKFVDSVVYEIGFEQYDLWKSEYPGDKYPVLALKGAPASYPVKRSDRDNQRYMVLSDTLVKQVDQVIDNEFKGQKFVGIHLRNGEDWSNACRYVHQDMTSYLSSPQCLDDRPDIKMSKELCFPSDQAVLKDLERLLVIQLNKQIRNVYIATDHRPLLNEIRAHFKDKMNLNLVHHDPWLPLIDLSVLARADYFIGNCMSSFTSYVKRERDIHGLDSYFWSINKN